MVQVLKGGFYLKRFEALVESLKSVERLKGSQTVIFNT